MQGRRAASAHRAVAHADAVAGVLTLRLPRLPTEARSSSSEAWGERGGKQCEVTRDTHGETDAQLPAGRGRPDTVAAGQSGRPKVSGAPAAGCSRLRLRRAVSGKTRPYCRLSAVIDFAGRLQITQPRRTRPCEGFTAAR